jgi:2'-5' RNA ligase
MHLTVRFIGHVADEAVPALLDGIRPPLAIPPFELALGECGVFPPSGPPRVLWIGLQHGQPGLRAMHDEFDRRLLPLRFEPENRPYSAHLTLARIKDAPRGSGRSVRETVRTVRPRAAACVILHATVFESRVSSQGARYSPLLRIPLLA